jgi:hypothetical protein
VEKQPIIQYPGSDICMDGGGCFLLSSQDYYYVRGLTSFASTCLGAALVSSDVTQTSLSGSGSVFNGLGPYTLSYPFYNYSDRILPDGTAEEAFAGDQGTAAVDKNSGSYRSAWLGFPVEVLATPSDRQQVLGAFINWCTAAQVVPPVPQGIQASFASFTDKVRVSWTLANGATYYEVFRNSSNSNAGASLLGSSAAAPFDDTTATTGTVYWYFVKACNPAGCSGFSLADAGFRGFYGSTYLPLVLRNASNACGLAPTLIYPLNGSSLDNLIPLFQWDYGNDPGALYGAMEVARDPGFTQIALSVGTGATQGPYQFRFYWNLDSGQAVLLAGLPGAHQRCQESLFNGLDLHHRGRCAWFEPCSPAVRAGPSHGCREPGRPGDDRKGKMKRGKKLHLMLSRQFQQLMLQPSGRRLVAGRAW